MESSINEVSGNLFNSAARHVGLQVRLDVIFLKYTNSRNDLVRSNYSIVVTNVGTYTVSIIY